MNIRFYLFLIISLLHIHGCSSAEYIPCAYTPQQTENNQYPEITQYDKCAQLINKTVIIFDKHLNKIEFNDSELSQIRVHDGLYYVNKQGKLARTHIFDNGADYFQEGLSRTIKNNKFGFINNKLDLVIKAEYDFAYPFENGLSIVCIGCKAFKVGEHTEMRNGKWGVIDKSGNVVIKISHGYDEIIKTTSKLRSTETPID